MHKYRIRYSRGKEARFISQLDFMRTMTRALRRARLPLQYSQGFNPHAVLSVAVPLSVGVTSDGECMDVGFETEVDPHLALKQLNDALPLGILALRMHSAEGLRPFKDIAAANYRVTFSCDKTPNLEDFLSQDTIEVDKRSKKGMRRVNIRPMIGCIEPEQDGKLTIWNMRLQAGEPSLKPELVLAALEEQQMVGIRQIQVHRLALYFNDGTEVV